MAQKQEYEKYYIFMMITAYVTLLINLYYFCHPVFEAAGLSHQVAKRVLLQLRDGGLFRSPFLTKSVAYVLLVMTHIVRSGKGKKVKWPAVIAAIVLGGMLYFIEPRGYSVYLATTVAGFGVSAWGIAMISRNLKAFNKPVEDKYESWPQCEELIDKPDSINIPIEYKYKGKLRNGWINAVNLARSCIIMGTPGAGKSYSIFNPIIQQAVQKNFVCVLYDYKYPDQSKILYNEYLRKYPAIKNPDYHKNPDAPEYIMDPKAPGFYIIDFNNPRKSHRCNPINAAYINDPADSAEIADIVMKNIAPNTVEKEDFFSMSAKVYLDSVVYFLSIYEGGKYCTFPHVVEMMGVDYKKVFAILSGYDELETKIKPFVSALEGGAQDQLQGQIASATIPLNKMASPALYWVLSGDDFRLDLNNPDDPKFLCIGNDPDRQSIYGTALALFTSRFFKLMNHKGKRKSMIFLDELPTVFIKGLDNLIATARSNKVNIIRGMQDKSQLIRDYSQKEADVILNTVGTYIVGQVLGKTAEDMSKSFGRRYHEPRSQTQNIDSESLQISYHQEEILPQSTITSLTRGYFFGWVANDGDIEENLFFGKVKVPVKEWEERRSHDHPMPFVTSFGDERIRAEVHGEMMSAAILRRWAINRIIEEGTIYDREEMEIRIKAAVDSLSRKEREAILDEEAEFLIEQEVAKEIRENYDRIRQDVQDIIARELPSEGAGDEENAFTNPLDELENAYY